MSGFNAMEFVKDRHKALAGVLYNDSIEDLEKYCIKYGKTMPKGRRAKWIAKAGALKAIQECTDFSEEDKRLAMQKAVKMGTNPFMEPYGYDEEQKNDE